MSGEVFDFVLGSNGNDGGAGAVAEEMMVGVSGKFAVGAQGVINNACIQSLRGIPQGKISKGGSKILGGGVGEISASVEPYLGIDLSKLGKCLPVAGKGSRSGRMEANFRAETLPRDEEKWDIMFVGQL